MLAGIWIPFIGTALGAACVLFMKKEIGAGTQKLLLGFASGVMIAASVWSLLIPAMEMAEGLGQFAFLPAVVGMSAGMMFLLLMDRLVPHIHFGSEEPEGIRSRFARTTMLVFAVTIHNLPEGMAVGVVFAGLLSGETSVSLAGAYALAIGISIQNFPEGAIISVPLHASGKPRGWSFLMGVLSGLVEPVGAFLTILLARFVTPLLPYMLAFAAGAMVYVVVEELIPETAQGEHSDLGTFGFALGFMIMMALDVALG
ncbi:MAG: ZIP family metal transporter [Lachnospiraceae bacterium]|nr:ZIP family metal transporter [Lachnospiraceae bacterium]